MTRFALALAVACLMLSIVTTSAAQSSQPAEKLKLSAPYTHENLTLFLILGPDTIKGDYLSLEEAMRQKKVIVHETGNVNELTVENVSDRPVYIQSGEIVKGGKQDRTLANDLVLAPHSKKVPIAAFCVEQGRWRQRGGESEARFASSTDAVAGAKMKLAAQKVYADGGGQQKVWDEAKENQAKLRQRLAAEVASTASPSSFQLTLENKNVQAEVEKYIEKLRHAVEKESNVIGYAAAINGKLACADTYGSSALFHKMWPKLLKSAAVEAAAEFRPDTNFEAPTGDEIRAALARAEDGRKTNTQLSRHVNVTAYDASDSVLFETRDLANSSAAMEDSYLHRNYLRKD